MIDRESKGDMTRETLLNSRQSTTAKQLVIHTTLKMVIINMRIGLETAVLPVVPPTKKKIPITATEAINLEYSKEWVNAMELELE